MSKSISVSFNYATLLGIVLVICFACAQETEVITKDKLGLTIPNPFGDEPIFETNNQNGRLVSLHIPFIYDFFIHCRGPVFSMDKDIRIRVLSGLMDFHWDKVKQTPESDAEGPVTFSMFGITLYNNHESQ